MFSVLHVERNPFFIEFARDMVKELEIDYVSANSPEQALKYLEKMSIDLIVTGLEFDHESGKDFILELSRGKFGNIPIIVLSANEDDEKRKELCGIGVLDFIDKSNLAEKFNGYINSYKTADFTHETLRYIKIAVLDDNEFEIRRIQDIFEKHKVKRVDYFSNPEELLNSEVDYDMYLIDYILPRVSGEQVVKRIREKLPYALIIAISSISNNVVISNILNSGADDFITKPYDDEVFMARLRANVRTYLLLGKLKEKNEELENLIRIDGLTGLYNHKAIIEMLEQEVTVSTRHKRALSIMMFDIDNFKVVNDKFGHQVGDKVLIKISEVSRGAIRKSDILGRYGGEEFLIIFPETQLPGAFLIAEKIRKAIEAMKFEEISLSVRISGGVAEMTNNTSIEMIREADDMLYKAKGSGKNKICKKVH